jgi:hypothetical protein
VLLLWVFTRGGQAAFPERVEAMHEAIPGVTSRQEGRRDDFAFVPGTGYNSAQTYG